MKEEALRIVRESDKPVKIEWLAKKLGVTREFLNSLFSTPEFYRTTGINRIGVIDKYDSYKEEERD